jgi:hypothetical protein
MIKFKLHSAHQTSNWSAPWTSRDYWVAHTLGEVMTDSGGQIVYGDADIDIYLLGHINEKVNPKHNNILWVIGHPQNMLGLLARNPGIINRLFRHVFCSSVNFCERLQNEYDVDAKWLVAPPPPRKGPDSPVAAKYQLAFVGNADQNKSRHKLAPIFSEFQSIVYGSMWDSFLQKPVWRGNYIPWERLPEIWNSASIVPYSTHEDMRQEGFVADACLDAMAHSNALVLPDRNKGFGSLGLETPQWETEEELRELVKYYLNDELNRRRLADNQKKGALAFTYKHVANVFLSCV